MESYAKWNLVPDIGEEVFVKAGRNIGFNAIVEKINGHMIIIRRNVPCKFRELFPGNTTLEIYQVYKIYVLCTNKKRLDEIKKLKLDINKAKP